MPPCHPGRMLRVAQQGCAVGCARCCMQVWRLFQKFAPTRALMGVIMTFEPRGLESEPRGLESEASVVWGHQVMGWGASNCLRNRTLDI
jgi:hypothetical protein